MLLMSRSAMGQPAQMCGRTMVGLRECVVKAANAAKPRRQCNVPHRKRGLVDQLLREVQPARLRHRDRTGTEMFQEKAPQMARADSQSFRERLDSAIFQCAFRDQAQRTRHRRRGAEPCGSSGRGFRTAAQAWP